MNYKFIKKMKPIIPLYKYCFGKNSYVGVSVCDCVNTCQMRPGIKVTYHTNLKCNMTNKLQKIDDCICNDVCSADQNDLEYYMEKVA